MGGPEDDDKALARQARVVALVIAGTMLVWMGAQWAGDTWGVETRFLILADLLALAGFLWALVVTYQIWRKRG